MIIKNIENFTESEIVNLGFSIMNTKHKYNEIKIEKKDIIYNFITLAFFIILLLSGIIIGNMLGAVLTSIGLLSSVILSIFLMINISTYNNGEYKYYEKYIIITNEYIINELSKVNRNDKISSSYLPKKHIKHKSLIGKIIVYGGITISIIYSIYITYIEIGIQNKLTFLYLLAVNAVNISIFILLFLMFCYVIYSSTITKTKEGSITLWENFLKDNINTKFYKPTKYKLYTRKKNYGKYEDSYYILSNIAYDIQEIKKLNIKINDLDDNIAMFSIIKKITYHISKIDRGLELLESLTPYYYSISDYSYIYSHINIYVNSIIRSNLSLFDSFYNHSITKLSEQIRNIEKLETKTKVNNIKVALGLQKKRLELLKNRYAMQLQKINKISNKI